MKKKVFLASAVVLLMILASVFLINKGGNTADAERIIRISSGFYTEAEIVAAMDAVEREFRKGFDGCRLLRIEYDEGKTLSERYYRSEQYGVDRVIVLESDFYAGSNAEACFSTEHTYTNWKWILTDEGSGWILRTSGYG